MNKIINKDDLGSHYGKPSERAVLKQLDHIDKHCRAFIELSPFLVIGTMGSDGLGDVSPRGDAPGFVLVKDEYTIFTPDITVIIPNKTCKNKLIPIINIGFRNIF